MMRKFLLIIAATLALTARAEAQHEHHKTGEAVSVHGMLLLGKSKIYISHLPMFHTPHDYQAIFEVTLSEAAKAAYTNELSTSNETVYTLVPEPFVMSEMLANPHDFSATIYRGHFERGGVAIASGVTVSIVNILVQRKFDPNALLWRTDANYFIFGNDEEQFIAHRITSKPDFDQIAKLENTPAAQKMRIAYKSKSMSLINQSNKEPLEQDQTLRVFDMWTGVADATVGLKVETVLYTETNDLSF